MLPNAKILVDYTGSFTDAGIGQAMAAKQYGAGAYIIFQVAGGSGNGVIKEAKERSAKGVSVRAPNQARGNARRSRSGLCSPTM